MTRYLLISILLLTGCKSAKTPVAENPCIKKFIPDFKSQWYRSTIDVRGHHFSGLFIFKTMPDSTLRVVFTNEAGVTFFHYQFSKNGDFKVVESIKPLRRKIVSNLLRKDLELITMMKARTGNGANVHYTTTENCSKLTSIERIEKENIKAKANFFGEQINLPDSIFVTHLDFDMEIKLRPLKKD